MTNNTDVLLKSYWTLRSETFQTELFKLLDSEESYHWLEHIAPHISHKNAKILDAGCANGFISFLLYKAGFVNITGIDFCKDMILKAKDTAIKTGNDIKFIEANIIDTDFPDESFDVIVCRNVLWQLSQPKEALKELYRILKANGVFISFDANRIEPVKGSSSEKITFLRKSLPSLQHQRPQWDVEILNETGFKSINVFKNIKNLKDSSPYSDLTVFKVLCRK
jgi:ubiquinone/menaquinone biosynthesis C-methylase UbiE